MAVFSFPPNPVNGEIYPDPPIPGSFVYVYDEPNNTWRIRGVAGAAAAGTYGNDITSVTITIDAAGIIQNIVDAPIRLAQTGLPGLAAPGVGLAAITPGTLTLIPPTATAIGGVRAGNNVAIDVSGVITVRTPTAAVPGAVKAGNNVTIASDGTLTVNPPTGGFIGAVRAGNNVAIDGSGVLTVLPPTATTVGAVRAGNTTSITPTGVIEIRPPAGVFIGGVKAGSNVNITADGSITANLATAAVPGVVGPGLGLSLTPTGFLNLLPPAGSDIGGVRAGNNVTIDNTGTITVNPPTAAINGVVRAGTNITISPDGVISSTNPGGTVTSIAAGTGIIATPASPITSTGTLSLGVATVATIGGVRPDGTSIFIDSNGIISAAAGSTTFWTIAGANLAPDVNGRGVSIFSAGGNLRAEVSSTGQFSSVDAGQTALFYTSAAAGRAYVRSLGASGSAIPLSLDAFSNRLSSYGGLLSNTPSVAELTTSTFNLSSLGNPSAFSVTFPSGDVTLTGNLTALASSFAQFRVQSSANIVNLISSQDDLTPTDLYLNGRSLVFRGDAASPAQFEISPSGSLILYNTATSDVNFQASSVTGELRSTDGINEFRVQPSGVGGATNIQASTTASAPNELQVWGEQITLAAYGSQYSNIPGSLVVNQTSVVSSVPYVNPQLTGVPTAPTAPNGTNTTQIATTAFVQNQVAGAGTVTQLNSGTGISLSPSPITTTGTISLNPAQQDIIGGVRGGLVGFGISIAADGLIALRPATDAFIGGIIVGDTLTITPAGVLDVNPDTSIWSVALDYLYPTLPGNGVQASYFRTNPGTAFPAVSLQGENLVFEEALGTFSTTINATAATANRIITFPNSSGTVLLDGDIPPLPVVLFSAPTVLNFGTIPAQSSVDLAVSVTGCLPSDVYSASPDQALPAGFSWCAYCNSANIAYVRMTNSTTTAADPDAGLTVSWRVSASRPPA